MVGASAVYRYTEEFWGDFFDTSLIERITRAPGAKLREYAEGWPFFDLDPPLMNRGALRPLIDTQREWGVGSMTPEGAAERDTSFALFTLLYAPEILVDRSYVNVFDGVEIQGFGSASYKQLQTRARDLGDRVGRLVQDLHKPRMVYFAGLAPRIEQIKKEETFAKRLLGALSSVEDSLAPDLAAAVDELSGDLPERIPVPVHMAWITGGRPGDSTGVYIRRREMYQSYLGALRLATHRPTDRGHDVSIERSVRELSRRCRWLALKRADLEAAEAAVPAHISSGFVELSRQHHRVSDQLSFTRRRLRFEGPTRELIGHRLHRMQVIRPFVEDGSIHFADLVSGGQRAFAFDAALKVAPTLSAEEIRELPSSGVFRGDTSIEGRLAVVTIGLEASLEMARRRFATPIARTPIESAIWERVVGALADDRRIGAVRQLARVGLPRYKADHQTLIRLRQQSDVFAGWRDSLEKALVAAQDIPDGPDGTADARALMFQVLEDSIASFPIEERKSAVLRSLREGAMTFSLSGLVGAGLGVATGQTLEAAAVGTATGAVGGAGVEAVRAYHASMRQSRNGRLLRDVYLGMYLETD
ncbi:hypothetical protein DEA06_06740 [Microbacterium sp. Gd 4-13]|uniref:hypothetical protein n=1 Tax=Microbacterium sp. Gd 4-13 TaxID=2173179 RepID=UPI000D57506B|nr:hypothetical protein [Microbacterium sp. Gd 4-13]PVW05430.1 hypothetical protein DEA06_06740 [Microbacterium sp. Gd 4-13]